MSIYNSIEVIIEKIHIDDIVLNMSLLDPPVLLLNTLFSVDNFQSSVLGVFAVAPKVHS